MKLSYTLLGRVLLAFMPLFAAKFAAAQTDYAPCDCPTGGGPRVFVVNSNIDTDTKANQLSTIDCDGSNLNLRKAIMLANATPLCDGNKPHIIRFSSAIAGLTHKVRYHYIDDGEKGLPYLRVPVHIEGSTSGTPTTIEFLPKDSTVRQIYTGLFVAPTQNTTLSGSPTGLAPYTFTNLRLIGHATGSVITAASTTTITPYVVVNSVTIEAAGNGISTGNAYLTVTNSLIRGFNFGNYGVQVSGEAVSNSQFISSISKTAVMGFFYGVSVQDNFYTKSRFGGDTSIAWRNDFRFDSNYIGYVPAAVWNARYSWLETAPTSGIEKYCTNSAFLTGFRKLTVQGNVTGGNLTGTGAGTNGAGATNKFTILLDGIGPTGITILNCLQVEMLRNSLGVALNPGTKGSYEWRSDGVNKVAYNLNFGPISLVDQNRPKLVVKGNVFDDLTVNNDRSTTGGGTKTGSYSSGSYNNIIIDIEMDSNLVGVGHSEDSRMTPVNFVGKVQTYTHKRNGLNIQSSPLYGRYKLSFTNNLVGALYRNGLFLENVPQAEITSNVFGLKEETNNVHRSVNNIVLSTATTNADATSFVIRNNYVNSTYSDASDNKSGMGLLLRNLVCREKAYVISNYFGTNDDDARTQKSVSDANKLRNGQYAIRVESCSGSVPIMIGDTTFTLTPTLTVPGHNTGFSNYIANSGYTTITDRAGVLITNTDNVYVRANKIWNNTKAINLKLATSGVVAGNGGKLTPIVERVEPLYASDGVTIEKYRIAVNTQSVAANDIVDVYIGNNVQDAFTLLATKSATNGKVTVDVSQADFNPATSTVKVLSHQRSPRRTSELSAPFLGIVGPDSACSGTDVTFCASYVQGSNNTTYAWSRRNGTGSWVGIGTTRCVTIPAGNFTEVRVAVTVPTFGTQTTTKLFRTVSPGSGSAQIVRIDADTACCDSSYNFQVSSSLASSGSVVVNKIQANGTVIGSVSGVVLNQPFAVTLHPGEGITAAVIFDFCRSTVVRDTAFADACQPLAFTGITVSDTTCADTALRINLQYVGTGFGPLTWQYLLNPCNTADENAWQEVKRADFTKETGASFSWAHPSLAPGTYCLRVKGTDLACGTEKTVTLANAFRIRATDTVRIAPLCGVLESRSTASVSRRQWEFCADTSLNPAFSCFAPIGTPGQATWQPEACGWYRVCITDAGNTDCKTCSSPVRVIIAEPEQSSYQALSIAPNVFPNPSPGEATLELSPTIEVMSMTGEVLSRTPVAADGMNRQKIDMRHLPNGMYMLRWETSNGPVIKKVVIRK